MARNPHSGLRLISLPITAQPRIKQITPSWRGVCNFSVAVCSRRRPLPRGSRIFSCEKAQHRRGRQPKEKNSRVKLSECEGWRKLVSIAENQTRFCLSRFSGRQFREGSVLVARTRYLVINIVRYLTVFLASNVRGIAISRKITSRFREPSIVTASWSMSDEHYPMC